MLRRVVVAVAATATCALIAVPLATGRADATGYSSGTSPASECGPRTTYTPFTFLGDTNQYYLSHGGDFESGTTDWFGAGISVVKENSPWRVGGAGHSSAVELDRTGATLSAPMMCVKDNEPTLRFFYKSPGVPGAVLEVVMRTSSTGGNSYRTVEIDGSKRGWQVSDPVTIQNTTDKAGEQKLYLDFTSKSGTWVVDDIYVDPWKYVIK